VVKAGTYSGQTPYEEGRRYYLADIQAHYNLPNPLVQGGQLYLVISPKF
jgi:hypothetical protein